MSDQAVLDVLDDLERILAMPLEFPNPDLIARWHEAFKASVASAERGPRWPEALARARTLGRLLKRLPGTKILLTNAPRAYSHAVLRHLGLHRHFVRHIPIEAMYVHRTLRPKPSKPLLRKILAREGIAARRCVLVEDTVGNLKAAKALGLRTAWITRYLGDTVNFPAGGVASARMKLTRRPAYVDVKVKSIGGLAKHLRRLAA